MDATEILLNIAVNLGRIGRWATEKKYSRIEQFFGDTDRYVEELAEVKKNNEIIPTLNFFEKNYARLKKNKSRNDAWAEEAFTLSNILIHRAKIARPSTQP